MSELSPEARALIGLVGDRDGPNPAHSARLSRKVEQSLLAAGLSLGLAKGAAGAAMSAGAVGTKTALGSALAAGTSVTALKCAAWFAAGIGLGSLVAAPVAVWTHSRPEQGGGAASAPSPARLPRSTNGREPMREAAVGARPATTASASARLRDVPLAEPSPSGGAPVAAFAGGVSEEMRLLGAAQRELSARRAGEALRLLEEHARKFPQGALSEERLAAQVLALCEVGRLTEARQAAGDFLSRSPASPLVPRIRESCGHAGSEGRHPGRTPATRFSEMDPPGSRD